MTTTGPGTEPPAKSRVVIVGAGFGGIEAALRLERAEVELAIVDRQNYHLFQPLLYQVATAMLQPADIAAPIRSLLFRRDRPLVYMDEVVGIDLFERIVRTRERQLTYDYLILAPGAQTSYFGNDEWRTLTFGLKTLDDAEQLRHQILLSFERAEMAPSAEERRRLMTFVIVGGGPNGVGTASALAELVKKTLVRDFRTIDPKGARIILVEMDERPLPGFPVRLQDYARRTLQKKGIEFRGGSPCEVLDEHAVSIEGERIEAGSIIWTAGVEAPQIKRWIDVNTDKSGRVEVGPDLSLPGQREVFVIGDAALVRREDGVPLPGLAAVAKQQGRYVADRILARIKGAEEDAPFRYRDYGTLVPLGAGRAIAQIGERHFTGLFAWLVWAAAHIFFLTDFRRRLMVFLNWFWAFATARRGARIIINRAGTDLDVMHHHQSKSDGERKRPDEAGSTQRALAQGQ